MTAVQPYSGDEPLQIVSTFQGKNYDLILAANTDRTRGYLSLKRTGRDINENDVQWRTAIDFFKQSGGLKLPESGGDFVGELIHHIVGENALQQYFFLTEGIEPKSGRDGYIEWLTSMKPSGDPKEDTSGRVNYYEVDNVINVAAGQVLAKIHPPENGTPGIDIFGGVVEPSKTVEIKVQIGKGVKLDAAQNVIHAEESGALCYVSGQISIEPVYLVKNDVDFSTGNVNFLGMISIGGQVLDGFQVTGAKDILIGGMVGAARIEAGGNLSIKAGVAGKDKARLVTGGKLQAKYLNSVEAEAQGNVEIFSEIVNSKVKSLGSIVVPKGKIFNAEVVANEDIVCDTLGSEMGVKTLAFAGVNHVLRQNIREIDEQFDKLTATFDRIRDKINPILGDKTRMAALSPAKIEVIKKLSQEMKSINEEREALKRLRLEKQAAIAQNLKRKIVVYRKVCPGVEVQIAECRKNIEQEIRGPLKFVVDEINRVVVMKPIFLQPAETRRISPS